jgi:hypothetical protein
MSLQWEKHPLYKTPSQALRMRASLNELELTMARMLMQDMDVTKTIRYSIRSWAAQLGLAGFDAGSTEVCLRNTTLEVETLVSDISGQPDDMLLQSLRRNVDGHRARVARVLLLPQEARIGERRLPLNMSKHYGFDRQRLTDSELDTIWQGKSGRGSILAIRKDLGAVPGALGPGQYLVGAVDANPGNECWVLEPALMRGSTYVDILHDQSCLYDPVRTKGERQVEIRNINGKAEPLNGLDIIASAYRTNLDLFHCAHTRGV